MRRRKYRERRNSAWERKWLQRELEASGELLNGRPGRPFVLPLTISVTSFEQFAVVETVPAKRRRERPREVPLFN